MIIFVKFDREEARTAFECFLDVAMGLTLRKARGFKGGWIIEGDYSLIYVFNYLHDLGAFKWYNEE